MFTDANLEEISASLSQPPSTRLLAELILEVRRGRASVSEGTAAILAAMKDSPEKKPPVSVKRK